MANMQLVFLGTSSAAPTVERGLSSIALMRGSELLLYVRLGDGDGSGEVRVVAPPDLPVTPDQPIGLRLDPERTHRFDAASGARIG